MDLLDHRDEELKRLGGGGGGVDIGGNSSLTLLPPSVANAVSLVARSSSLYLRLGTFIGKFALYGARNSTLTGLELSRAIMENILIRAGKDVAHRTSGGLGEAEAEGLLDKSLTKLHSTITNISFAVSTGFYFSSAILNSACNMSQMLITALDSIFGSTDSSRAIAGIITLIRREFQNPATGREGEKVGVIDLLVGICGLAFLQRWCSRITDSEDNSSEIIWDVVVLNNGKRADVLDTNGLSLVKADSIIFMPNPGQNNIIYSMDRQSTNIDCQYDNMPEILLKERIIRALPSHASISVNTQTSTTKIITVIITGAKPPNVSLPKGIELIEEEPFHLRHIEIGSNKSKTSEKQETSLITPIYRMIYRVQKDTSQKFESPGDFGHNYMSNAIMNGEPTHSTSGLIFSPKLTIESRNYSDVSILKQVKTNPRRFVRQYSMDNMANQKRSRRPMNSSSSSSVSLGHILSRKSSVNPASKIIKHEQTPQILPFNPIDIWEPSPSQNLSRGFSSHNSSYLSSPRSSTSPAKDVSRLCQQRGGNANYSTSRDLGTPDLAEHTSLRPGYHLGKLSHSNPVISQVDNLHINSSESSSVSSNNLLTQLRAQSLLRARSEKQIASPSPDIPPLMNHRRSKSYVSSIHALKSNNSATSMIFTQPRSAFSDLDRLSRTGFVDGMFPKYHLVRNITRYVRFASASYGSNFLRVMGITTGDSGREIHATHHYEHHSFSTHTQLPPSTILLSSFVDPKGGTDSTGNTNTGVPMVHYVSLDHDSKAVILTCRGTLGFEDVLTDMTCDYDELMYRGKAYQVHKGIHASARRLLDGGGGRVMATISTTLEKFPEYGLVLCGHSLGGAVSSLLAVMISAPNSTSTAFFTTSHQPLLANSPSKLPINLPEGRRIHVYAYGPPATMCPSLRLATRGLVTTIVNDQDFVPYLSLGLLHDLQATALAFKTDDTGTKSEVTKRVWQGITGKFSDTWYNRQRMVNEVDDQWAYSTLKTLRACMLSTKLVPPGEVFVVETMPILQRDGLFKGPLGGPATRVVVKYVKDVEKRFGEIQFGGSMLLDHSPGRYEASLSALSHGVLGR